MAQLTKEALPTKWEAKESGNDWNGTPCTFGIDFGIVQNKHYYRAWSYTGEDHNTVFEDVRETEHATFDFMLKRMKELHMDALKSYQEWHAQNEGATKAMKAAREWLHGVQMLQEHGTDEEKRIVKSMLTPPAQKG
jgi:hypothetical protein